MDYSLPKPEAGRPCAIVRDHDAAQTARFLLAIQTRRQRQTANTKSVDSESAFGAAGGA